jgi:hypothetical protein
MRSGPDADRTRGATDAAVERMLGARVVASRPVAGGYTYAANRMVQLADGRSAFVKAAVDDLTRGWLRAERRIYAAVEGPFIPRCLGWEDGDVPVLVLEDLSAAIWPPPWPPGGVRAVLDALDALHAVPAPAGLPPSEAVGELRVGWDSVAADPAPFLALGVCSPAWLERVLPALREAVRRAPFDGDALVHLDVRSDNLCLRDGRCLLVDWSHAARANPRLDAVLWLPSLVLEGGAVPDALESDAATAALMTAFAGYLAARAGLPEPATVPPPGVRALQLAQLRIALPWAARRLGLSEP